MYRNVLKIGFIGTENVGKTLLCNKISGRKLERGYIATIGVDLIIKYLNINAERILFARRPSALVIRSNNKNILIVIFFRK